MVIAHIEVTLRPITSVDGLGAVPALLEDYVAEIGGRLLTDHGVDLAGLALQSDLLVDVTTLLVPPNRLYLAEVDGRAAGTGGLKRLAADVVEIKRMYVDPAFRGRGVGRAV